MEGLEAKAVELLDKLEKITITLTPQALDVAEGCMRVAGLQRVVIGLIILAITFLISYKTSKKDYGEGNPAPAFIYIICTGAAVVGSSWLFNIWNWIAIFNPKLAIANKLLGF